MNNKSGNDNNLLSTSKDILNKTKSSFQSNRPSFNLNFWKIQAKNIKSPSKKTSKQFSMNQKTQLKGHNSARNISFISNGRNTANNLKSKFDQSNIINNTANTKLSNPEKVISLTNSTINVLSQTMNGFNKNDNKRKMALVKHTLAQVLLNHPSDNEENLVSKIELCRKGSLTDKGRVPSVSINKTNSSPQINKIEYSHHNHNNYQRNIKPNQAVNKKKDIHRNKAVISNDSNNSEISFKRDYSRDLHHHSINYNSNYSSSIIGNKIMTTFKDYEEAIQTLRKANSKHKENNSNSREMIYNDKNPKVSLLKHHYSTLLEEKERTRMKKPKSLRKLSYQDKLMENDLRRQLELKNEEIESLKERLELIYNIEDLGFSINPNCKEEDDDKNDTNAIIQELSNELKCKMGELDRLKEKEAKREKEIEEFYIQEMNTIKDSYEKTINKLKEERDNANAKTKEAFVKRIGNKNSKMISKCTINQFEIINTLNGQRYNEDIESSFTIMNNMTNLTNQVKEKENMITQLQESNNALTSELHTITVGYNELTKCKIALEEERKSNRTQMEALSNQLSLKEREREASKENETYLTEQLSLQKTQYDKYKIELDELKEIKDTLISQKACLEEELYQLKIKIEEEDNNKITELNYQNELNDESIQKQCSNNNNDKEANHFNNNEDDDSPSFFKIISNSINHNDINIKLPPNKITIKSNSDYFHKEQSQCQTNLLIIKQLQEEHSIILSKKDLEINSLIKQIENITESCKILKKINKDKNDIILDLKSKLSKVCDLRTEVEKEIDQLRTQNEDNSNTISQLQNQLNQIAKEKVTLTSELESKCSTILLKNNQIDNLSTISLQLEKKIGSMSKDIDSKKEELAQLKMNSRQLTFSNTIEECDGSNSKNNHYQVKIASRLYVVLCEKRYKGLQWYLITRLNKTGIEAEDEDYSNTLWIEGNMINEQLMTQYENMIQKEKDIHKQRVSMLICKNQKSIGKDEVNKPQKLQNDIKKISDKLSDEKIVPSL